MKRRWLFIAAALIIACQNEPTGPSSLAEQSRANRDRAVDNCMVAEEKDFSSSLLTTQSDSTLTILSGHRLFALDSGDYLALKPCARFPFGALRRITGRIQAGDTAIVELGQASLTDIFERLHVRFNSSPFTQNDLFIDSTADSVLKKIHATKGTFTVDFDNHILFDKDKDPATTTDRLVLDGSLSFTPAIAFTCVIEDYCLDSLCSVLTIQQTSRLQLTSTLAAPSIEKKFTLRTLYFKPIVIPTGTPVPLVLTPCFTISLGYSGDASLQVAATVTQEYAGRLGVTYGSRGWSPVQSTSSSATEGSAELFVRVDCRGYAMAAYRALVYDLVGPQADLAAQLALANPTPDTLSLDFLVPATLRVASRVFSDALEPYSKSVVLYQTNLMTIANNLPAPIVNPFDRASWDVHGTASFTPEQVTIGDNIGPDPDDVDADGNNGHDSYDYDKAYFPIPFLPPFRVTWEGLLPHTGLGYNSFGLLGANFGIAWSNSNVSVCGQQVQTSLRPSQGDLEGTFVVEVAEDGVATVMKDGEVLGHTSELTEYTFYTKVYERPAKIHSMTIEKL